MSLQNAVENVLGKVTREELEEFVHNICLKVDAAKDFKESKFVEIEEYVYDFIMVNSKKEEVSSLEYVVEKIEDDYWNVYWVQNEIEVDGELKRKFDSQKEALEHAVKLIEESIYRNIKLTIYSANGKTFNTYKKDEMSKFLIL